jgi:penicillin-binding protein 1C
LGTERVLHGLRAAGFASLSAGADRYGLGLVLGVGEVTLLELAQAYAGLARGGTWQEAIAVQRAYDAHDRSIELGSPAAKRWLRPDAAFLAADALCDDAARVPGFGARSILDLPFPVAVKTGTSTDFRNTWCVGFDADHVVAVWAGNFDASPVDGLTGTTGAGPVFRSIMLRLQARGSRAWIDTPPPGWRRERVCVLSGGKPGDACNASMSEWFAPGSYEGRERCTFHVRRGERVALVWPSEYVAWARANDVAAASRDGAAECRIASPLDGSIYFRDPRLASQGIRIAAAVPTPSDRWFLDGRALATPPGAAAFTWPPEPGTHRLELRRDGMVARVRFAVR